MHVSEFSVACSLSRTVNYRFMADGAVYGITSQYLSFREIKSAIWHTSAFGLCASCQCQFIVLDYCLSVLYAHFSMFLE